MWLKTSEFCVVYSGNSPCWIAWVELGVWLGECGSSWNIWVEFEARADVCGTIVVSLVEDLLYFQFGPVLSQCIINNMQLMCNMWTIMSNASSSFWSWAFLRAPTTVSKASSFLEIFTNFLWFERGLFVDLVVDIVDEAHDSLSLSDRFSKLSKSDKELSSTLTCWVSCKEYIFF